MATDCAKTLSANGSNREDVISSGARGAGVAGAGGYLWENSATDWHWTLGVNLIGVASGIREFVPRMLAAGLDEGGGHIVNTASIAGWLCAPLMGAYNASKSAVVALSETLYNDLRLAGSGIGVSSV